MTDETPEPLKLMTYSTQWYFDNLNLRFYFKRDPEWSVGLDDFDKTFALWDFPEEASPAARIMKRYESHCEGRSFFPEKPAGLILHNGRRLVNVPVRRRDRLEREAAERGEAIAA